MIVQLIINQVIIEIPSDQITTIQNQESFLYRASRGERSFPYRLPWTATLRQLFGYPETVSFTKISSFKTTAILKADGYLITEGTLAVTDANEKYLQVEFRIPPGNVPATIWNKKLRACDWGKIDLPTTTVTASGRFKKMTVPPFPLSFGFTGSAPVTIGLLFLYADSVLIATNNVKYTVTLDPFNPFQASYTIAEADLKACLSNFFSDSPAHTITYENGTMVVTADEPMTTLRMYYGDIGFNILVLDSTPIQYQSVGDGYNQFSNPDIITSPFVLPNLYNANFYNSGTANTYLNVRKSNGDILTNDEDNPLQNTVVPCLRLRFILDKVLQEIGYTLEGDLATDSDLKFIAIATNVAASRALAGSANFDLFASTINYAYYAPDFTVKEFFDYLLDQFGFASEFDTTMKVVKTTYIKSHIESNASIVVENLTKTRKVRISDAKNIRIKWANVDETLEQYLPVPVTELENSESIELKFPPLKFDGSLYLLTENGVTEIGGQTKESPTCYAFFAGENGSVSLKKGNWNLSLQGENNLYDKVFAPQIPYLSSPEYEYSSEFTLSKLLGITANSKLNIEGVNCFRKEIIYKIRPNSTIVDVTLTLVVA